jgi:NAD(P)-dependent dehydrogenase (short-subunit alcohol dehydrogenase family)
VASEPRRFDGRVALVTGGGTGIGRATALRLAEEGAAVALSGRRRDVLEETSKAIADAGGRALSVPGDVSLEDEADGVVSETVEAFGQVDLLVNNAGSIRRNVLLHELSTERWDEQLAANLRSVFLVTRAALRHMLELQGDRSIVNVASTFALAAGPGVAAYTAAKGGVISLTRALAVEYASSGIRVNCVCPGIVVTPLAYVDRPRFEKQKEEFARLYPLGRLGEPEDIAAAIAYLASADAGWVTGTVMTVDGGFTAK